MGKFVFSLSRMLSYKEQAETAEKNKLAALHARKNSIESQLEYIREQSRQVRKKLQNATQLGVTAEEVAGYNFTLQNNLQYEQQLKKDIQNAELSIQIQLHTVLEATKEVKGLLKLKEKQYDEFVYEENKKEQVVVSEFISSKLVREKNNN